MKQVQSIVTFGEKITVRGNVLALGLGPMTIRWRAPAPSTRRFSFSGSGLPHPNVEQAYDVRASAGEIKSLAGEFVIVLDDVPGAYYSGLGSIYVPPHVEIEAMSQSGKVWRGTVLIKDIEYPFRWLSGAPPGYAINQSVVQSTDEGRAMFYRWNPDGGVKAGGQEGILRSRAYPTHN
jgi:hypothetical protein